MPSPPRLGQYRHTPGLEMARGPDGRLRPTRLQRRFPFRGLVVMAYGALTPLVALAVTLLFQLTGNGRYLPRHFGEQSVPRTPSLENLLFGAGLPELVLAGALTGFLLWNQLWKLQVPPYLQEVGLRGVLPSLLRSGVTLGLLLMPLATLVGAYGLCLRAMPREVPWLARALFGVPGALLLAANSVLTGIVPLVLLLLGVLAGAGTALAVALVWPYFPEEPATR